MGILSEKSVNVAFDVFLEKAPSGATPPPVKKRLESWTPQSSTTETLNDKLSVADERRKRIASSATRRAGSHNDRVGKVRSDKRKNETVGADDLEETISNRLDRATDRRATIASKITGRLRRKTRLKLRRGARARERANASRRDLERRVEDKLNAAEEKKREGVTRRVDRLARTNGDKFKRSVRTRMEQEDSAKRKGSAISSKLERANRRKKINVEERTKCISATVEDKRKRGSKAIRESDDAQRVLDAKIAAKIHAAADRREELLAKKMDGLSTSSVKKCERREQALQQRAEQAKKLEDGIQEKLESSSVRKHKHIQDKFDGIGSKFDENAKKAAVARQKIEASTKALEAAIAAKADAAGERKEALQKKKATEQRKNIDKFERASDAREAIEDAAQQLDTKLRLRMSTASARKEKVIKETSEKAASDAMKKAERTAEVRRKLEEREIALGAEIERRMTSASVRKEQTTKEIVDRLNSATKKRLDDSKNAKAKRDADLRHLDQSVNEKLADAADRRNERQKASAVKNNEGRAQTLLICWANNGEAESPISHCKIEDRLDEASDRCELWLTIQSEGAGFSLENKRRGSHVKCNVTKVSDTDTLSSDKCLSPQRIEGDSATTIINGDGGCDPLAFLLSLVNSGRQWLLDMFSNFCWNRQ